MSTAWTRKSVDAVKKQIREELNALPNDENRKSKLEVILQKAEQFAGDTTPGGQLQQFIYLMSALVHHEKNPVLSSTEVKKITNHLQNLLLLNRVLPNSSQLSYLHGELHLVLSQIKRKAGEHLLSAWEQQICVNSSKGTPPGGRGFQALSAAIRAMRLGQTGLAALRFAEAEDSDLSADATWRAKLGRAKALRLSDRLDEADELCTVLLSENPDSQELHGEIIWEQTCQNVQKTGDLSQMISLVRRGKFHYLPEYLTEAFLWSRCVKDNRWDDSLVTMSYLARKKGMRPQSLGQFFRSAQEIESLYDYETPFVNRLNTAGAMLNLVNEVVTIDKELLILAATARWLFKSRSYNLATIVFGQYRNYCYGFTGGKNPDILGVLGDLVKSEHLSR